MVQQYMQSTASAAHGPGGLHWREERGGRGHWGGARGGHNQGRLGGAQQAARGAGQPTSALALMSSQHDQEVWGSAEAQDPFSPYAAPGAGGRRRLVRRGVLLVAGDLVKLPVLAVANLGADVIEGDVLAGDRRVPAGVLRLSGRHDGEGAATYVLPVLDRSSSTRGRAAAADQQRQQ